MRYLRWLASPIGSYLTLVVIFFTLVAALPPSWGVMHDFGLSSQQYHVMFFIIELPLAAIWFAAFYSYGRLQDYARTVASTTEGESFRQLAIGSRWLAWGLALPSLIGLIVNAIANHRPSFQPTAIIIVNYLNVLFPLIAFTYISRGTHHLMTSQRLRHALPTIRLMMLGFIVLGVLYCCFIFQHLDVRTPSSTDNPYYLPVWLVVGTIIIPNLYAWFIGLFATQELRVVARHVKGVLYRQAISLLASGVGVVIAGSIGIQYLRSIIPRTGHLSLNAVLLAVNLIYIVMIIGFVLMILGANRLKKIEDI